jgi:hypothetical protein
VIRSLNAANECKVVHGLLVAAFRSAWSGLVSNFALRVLYPDEKSLGQWILGDWAREWLAKAAVLERQGLPRIDPLMGGRFWPAVKTWFSVVMDSTPHP